MIDEWSMMSSNFEPIKTWYGTFDSHKDAEKHSNNDGDIA